MKNYMLVAIVVIGVVATGCTLIVTGEYKNFIDTSDEETFTVNTDESIATYITEQSDVYKTIEIDGDDTKQMSDEEVNENNYATYTYEDGKKYVYTQHSEVQTVPELTSFDGMNTMCYPGSLVALDISGNQTYISNVNLQRAPMTLTIVGLETVPGVDPSKLTIICKNGAKSTVIAAVAQLTGAANGLSNLPVKTEYKISEVTNQSSLNAALGMAGGYGGFKADINVDYETEKDYHTTVIVLKQIVYTVEMDVPASANQLFTDNVTSDDVKALITGNKTLAYTNVQYGKVVIITIKSEKDSSEIATELGVGVSDYFKLEAKLSSLQKSDASEIHIFAYGVQDNALVDTSDVSKISKYLSADNGTPAPIGYIFCSPNGNVLNYYVKSEYITRQVVDDSEYDGKIHIRNTEHVEKIKNNPSGTFVLDMQTLSITSPLLDDTVFTGKFDGNGNTIKLSYSGSCKIGDDYYTGLFAKADNAVMENVILDCTIQVDTFNSGNHYIGGLFGSATNCTVTNCKITGSITSITSGMTGAKAEGNDESYGGCVAGTFSGKIDGCSCSAGLSIYGKKTSVGGVVGCIRSNASIISNCTFSNDLYSRGAAGILSRAGTSHAGGIVGLIEATTTLSNCHSESRNIWAHATNPHVGGLVGKSDGYSVTRVNSDYLSGSLYTEGWEQDKKKHSDNW